MESNHYPPPPPPPTHKHSNITIKYTITTSTANQSLDLQPKKKKQVDKCIKGEKEGGVVYILLSVLLIPSNPPILLLFIVPVQFRSPHC